MATTLRAVCLCCTTIHVPETNGRCPMFAHKVHEMRSSQRMFAAACSLNNEHRSIEYENPNGDGKIKSIAHEAENAALVH